MTLDSLQFKLESIGVNSGGLADFDFFLSLQEFFSQDDIQEKMLERNRDRLYEDSRTSMGRLLPIYAESTARHKRKVGLPSRRYTYYESGDTHKSLEVVPTEDFVGIYPSESAPDYVEFLDGDAWGLTDKDFDEVVRKEMKNYLVNKLKDYIYG